MHVTQTTERATLGVSNHAPGVPDELVLVMRENSLALVQLTNTTRDSDSPQRTQD